MILSLLFAGQLFGSTNIKVLYEKYKVENVSNSTEDAFSTPLYNNLSFRARRAEEEGSRPENTYAIRLSPLAWGQYGQERELNSEYSKLSKWFNTESSSQSCLDKNISFINLYYNQQKINYLNQITLVFEDLVSVLKRSMTRDITEFNELLNAQEKQIEYKTLLKNQKHILENVVVNIKNKTASEFNPTELNFEDMIDVPDIKQNITDFNLKSIEVAKLKTIANIKNLEYEISQKKDSQIIDYFQVSNRNNEDTEERTVSLEIGFNIPFFHKRSSVSDIIAKQKAQLDYHLAQKEAASEMKGAQTELQNLIKDYQELSQSSYLTNLIDLQNYLLKSNLNSPYKILQVKEKILAERIKLLDMKYEILKMYLESMLQQGLLKECSVTQILK